MARTKLITSHDVRKLRVLGGKKGTKRIGKVKACVFHPTERRIIGFTVKRPDLLWMFHRKDIFVALDGFDFVDGRIRIKPEAPTSGPVVCKAMGISWDKCVLWEGLPMMTADETVVGYVSNVTFDLATGKIQAVEANNGATAKLLLGTLEVPAEYIQGFKRGVGATLAVRDDSRDAGDVEEFKGAIMVSDDVWELSPEGGWAEAAGTFTAKAGAKASEAVAKAKPKVAAAGAAASAAASEGVQTVGKQVSATKDAFGAFKEEFSRAAAGEEPEEVEEPEDSKPGMFAAFKEEFAKAAAGEDDDAEPDAADDAEDGDFEAEYEDDEDDVEYEEDDEYEDEDDEESDDEEDVVSRTAKKAASKYGGMFASFKEEFDKASKE